MNLQKELQKLINKGIKEGVDENVGKVSEYEDFYDNLKGNVKDRIESANRLLKEAKREGVFTVVIAEEEGYLRAYKDILEELKDLKYYID